MPEEDLALPLVSVRRRVYVGLAELEVSLGINERAALEGPQVVVRPRVEGEHGVPRCSWGRT